jgi:O-antigen/teichoic acid export membrane protein
LGIADKTGDAVAMRRDIYEGSTVKRALHAHFILKFVNLILGLLFQVLVVKILSPEEFATYAVLLAAMMAGERALSFGIDRTILRFLPALSVQGELGQIVSLGKRLALIRLGALAIFILVLSFVARFSTNLLPVEVSTSTLVAFAIWFIGYTLYTDADALAQSLIEHVNSTTIAAIEVLGRFSAVAWLGLYLHDASAHSVITVCAITMITAALSLTLRLLKPLSALLRSMGSKVEAPPERRANVSQAITFAVANYASTISWLISSPATVRIIAASALNVLMLAAFSFAQGLYISFQRALPGLFILPSLEPILMARASSGQGHEKTYTIFSVIFKAELICIMAALIATTIAGKDIIQVLSKPAYDAYYYILPVLILNLTFGTAYRILEIIAIINFKQRIFFLFWPLGLTSTLAMYLTVGAWGLWSVLIFPTIENLLTIGILLFAFRRQEAWRALDPLRSISLSLGSGLIVAALFVAQHVVSVHYAHQGIFLAAAGIMLLILFIFLLRPFRHTELETILTAMPSSRNFVRRFVLAISRP